MHDNTVVMCVYFVKHPSLRQSRARLFTPLSVLAKTTRFSTLLQNKETRVRFYFFLSSNPFSCHVSHLAEVLARWRAALN